MSHVKPPALPGPEVIFLAADGEGDRKVPAIYGKMRERGTENEVIALKATPGERADLIRNKVHDTGVITQQRHNTLSVSRVVSVEKGKRMHPGEGWYFVSTVAFSLAALCLLVCAFVFFSVLSKLSPLLEEAKDQIQDLGDLTTNTVGRAADTMDLVELRVSQTMGQATLAGKETTRQALGLGTTLAGLYVAARFVGALSGNAHAGRKRARKRRWF
jgi:hypothetical protein